MIPGRALHRLASRAFSVKTMQLVVEPAIADLQKEHREAVRVRRIGFGVRVLLVGYVGVFKAIALCVWEACMNSTLSSRERHAIVRAGGFLVLTALLATLALVVAVRFLPLHFDWAVYRSHRGYLIARSLPLGIAIAVPYMVAAVCRASHLSGRANACVLALVACLSIASFATYRWVVPSVTGTTVPDASARYGIFGVFTGPGMERMSELSREERRRIALASPNPNHSVTWNSRFISYSSGSIAFAPLVLGAFVVAACRQRRMTRLAVTLVPTAALGLYLVVMAFSDNTKLYPDSWWIWRPGAVDPFHYLVWIPNAVLALLAIAIFMRRPRHQHQSAHGPAEAGPYRYWVERRP